MMVVDASVWIDYFNGRVTPETNTLDALLGQQILIVGDITLTEVLQGFPKRRGLQESTRLAGVSGIPGNAGPQGCGRKRSQLPGAAN